MEGNEKCNNSNLKSDGFKISDMKTTDSRNNEAKGDGDKKNEEELKSKAFEDEGEDLPDNFFDDFSNQDFMAGLDIVDDWIDDDVNENKNDNDTTDKTDQIKSDRTNKKYEKESVSNKDRHRDRRHRSRSPRRRSPRRICRSPRRKTRSPRPRRHGSPLRFRGGSPRRSPRPRLDRNSRSPRRRRSRSKHTDQLKPVEDAKSDSGRRDPEKTKRDIQRDKIRCAKDHEARVFQEQLKVAETGLVPPGMELDIVLQSELFKDKDSKIDTDIKDNDERKKEEIKESSRVSSDQRKKRRSSRSRRESPLRKYSRSRSRPRISMSPKRWKRSRSYERVAGYDHHTRKSSREVDLRYHLREKRERYKHDLSPISDKKLSRSPVLCNISPDSNISERETWLRSKSRRSRNYSRSLSPRFPTKKYSFMEEIEIKLGQTSTNNKYPPQVQPLMSVPVPNPNTPEFFTGTPMNFPPYQPMIMGPGPNIPPGPTMVPPPDPFQFQPVQHPNPGIVKYPINLQNQPLSPMMNFPVQPVHFPQSQQVPAPPVPHPINSSNYQTSSNLKNIQEENKELTKLFEDKKISLSDFLSVSAKSLDGTGTPDLHSRIKIISRCQDAIKTLEDPNIMGRFIPKVAPLASNETETKHEEKTKFQSPMRKVTVVRFNFTTPVNKRQHTSVPNYPSIRGFLHKVLVLLGIGKIEENISVKPVPKPQPLPVTTTIPPAPVPPPIISVKKSIHIQTEPAKCQICEIRKSRKYETSQTQTIQPTTYDVSTQVNIEDLNKSPTGFAPRGILKNTPAIQSIAHLTPSQLLAQLQQEKKEDLPNKPWINTPKKEIFLAGGRSFQDQFSPDKPRPLMDESFNRNQFTDFSGGNSGGFRGEQSQIGGRRPTPFIEQSNMGGMGNNRGPFDRIENRSFDSVPNRSTFDGPTRSPFDAPNRSTFDGSNRPVFDGLNRLAFDGSNRQQFDSSQNRPNDNRTFDGPYDPRRFFEPNNPIGGMGISSNNRFTNQLNPKIFNRGPN